VRSASAQASSTAAAPRQVDRLHRERLFDSAGFADQQRMPLDDDPHAPLLQDPSATSRPRRLFAVVRR
jgi:hypothetical protein